MLKSSEKLPQGVRMISYSFLSLQDLLRKVSKLSKSDRASLANTKYQKEHLKQPRNMSIDLGTGQDIDMASYDYMLNLATAIQLKMSKCDNAESLLLEQAHKILVEKQIPLTLHLSIRDEFKYCSDKLSVLNSRTYVKDIRVTGLHLELKDALKCFTNLDTLTIDLTTYQQGYFILKEQELHDMSIFKDNACIPYDNGQ